MEDYTMLWRELPVVLVRAPATWDDLPSPLMADILSRLPVKTLIWSTSVNKSWYAFITDPKFISEHITRSISIANKNGDSFLLLTPTSLATSSNPCSFLSEKSMVELKKFEIPFRTKHGTVKILGSCNGLVCLTEEFTTNCGRDVYLWNPSLRKYKTLVNSCYPDLLHDSYDWLKALKTSPALGYGYHQPTNDYRVVRILYRADDQYDYFGKLDPRIEVYSLRSDSWRKIKARVPNIVNHNYPMYLNGAIYWAKMSNPNEPPPPYESVISFDLTNEVFREFKLPSNIRSGFREDFHQILMDFKGSVGVLAYGLSIDNGGCQRCSLWVMTEDGSSVPWTRKLNFVLPLRLAGIPLKFSKSGKLILEGPIDKRSDVKGSDIKNLASLNTNNFEVKRLGNNGPYTLDADFVESLVLLEGGKFTARV